MANDAHSRPFTAPQGSLFRREFRAAREPFRMALESRQLLAAPKGDGPVMVLPGFSTNDSATGPLRVYLKALGYRVSGWNLGVNRGQVRETLPAVTEQVELMYVQNGRRPIALVGWSLGGVFAREVARDHPQLVAQVITMATPIYGGPRFTVSAENYTEAEITAIEASIAGRMAVLIERRITAFYSRRDGAVDWRTCIDEVNPHVENVEVESSHLGITIDPTVWLEIADRLST